MFVLVAFVDVPAVVAKVARDAVPVRFAVIVPAEKLPVPSLRTIVPAVLLVVELLANAEPA